MWAHACWQRQQIMQQNTEKFEYFLEFHGSVKIDEVQDCAPDALTSDVQALLKKYTPEVHLNGNDIDWNGEVWGTWRITYHVSSQTKMLIDMLWRYH